MKNYSYYWELKNLIIQFMRALDDCVIKRYDNDRIARQDIAVRIHYTPKQKMIYDLTNKQKTLELPAMAVSIGGIRRDQNRVFNKIDGPTLVNQNIMNPRQPVPIDITMNVGILTKYPTDMDQIISNIIPYFDPYIIISWKHPDIDQEIRSKVTWDGNISYNYPSEQSGTTKYQLATDLTFTISGWLFKKSEGNSGIIHNIISDFIPLKELEYIESQYLDSYEYDRIIVSGVPIVTNAKPFIINTGEENTIYLSGQMLDKSTRLYLSGSMFDQTSANYIDLYSSEASLSADNPPFYGTEIIEFESIGNALVITLDSIPNAGFADIIVANDAGYGSIIKNASELSILQNGIVVADQPSDTSNSFIFIASDKVFPNFVISFEQHTLYGMGDNPVFEKILLPVYKPKNSSDDSDNYSNTALTIPEITPDNVASDRQLEIKIDNDIYYIPTYSALETDIIPNMAMGIRGKITSNNTDRLVSVGYAAFNYNDSARYFPLYQKI